ncbi:MAG: hypothetical protein K2P51_02725 [Rhabdochlamydiaceae bacterium]|nr:hypothetical protein [Rhabdochlamydiaceae bacterium]
MRKLIACLLFAFAAIATARFCHHQTHGFRLSKIQNNLCPSFNAPDPLKKECVEKLLNQKFRYFNRGLQSFVFLSEDGTTVLKIFNNRYQRKIFLFDLLSRFPPLRSWAAQRKMSQSTKLENTFKSYEIASTELAQQTGTLYAHLTPTSHLPSSLQLLDPLNICHTIDPNVFGFVLQRKATMAYATLLELIKVQDLSTARERLKSLVQFLIVRCQQGIADKDPLIRTNFGFLGETPIAVDLGPFSKDPTLALPEVYRPEILRITQSLKNWLNEKEPKLVPILEQELQQQLYCSE